MCNVTEGKAIEYHIFPETFLCLKLSGYWAPSTIKQRWLQLCYSLYTTIVSLLFCTIIFGIAIDMVMTRKNGYSHILESWCLMAIDIHTLYICLNLVMKRNQIIDLIRTKLLIERWIILRDAEEVNIIGNSKKNEAKILEYWMTLIAANAISHALPPIIGDNANNELLWDTWSPCDKRVSSCFWMLYSHQILSYSVASLGHVASGCIVLNLLERLFSHIRILQHRLSLLPDLVQAGVLSTAEEELLYLNECILDHQNIYSTAKEMSRIFGTVIFCHFMLISSILCTTIYLLSSTPLFSLNFLAGSSFLCCMMSQFFLFCWLGHKITEFSRDVSYTVFSTNWLELRHETRKRLRFIMLSASKSIPLFNNFIVELSPEMFLKLVKMSYSAFNLLQTQN